MSEHLGFGIDIGGTGMKGAIVDLNTGELASDRYRIPTPHPSTPEAMCGVVAQIVEYHGWTEHLGVCFPGIVRHGFVHSASNVDKTWIDVDADVIFSEAAGAPAKTLNDADAAGIAEMYFGAGRGCDGVVLVLTFGTGIGSALFVDGVMVPNTEFGHVELDGHDAERKAAASARDREDLSWKHWARRVEKYLRHMEMLLSPDLIIAGGGVSKHPHKWLPRIDIDTEIVPAALANNAGIVGAAVHADRFRRRADGLNAPPPPVQ
ncbi:MAG: ROK family protein [Actinomycetota bacterium]